MLYRFIFRTALALAFSLASFGQSRPKFPSSVVTDVDLYGPDPEMFSQPVLAASMSAVDTTLTLTTPAPMNLSTGGILWIENERLSCTTYTSGTSFSGCTRGVGGSVAASHAAGSIIFEYASFGPRSQVNAEVKAIETYLAAARVADRIDLWAGDVTGNNTSGRWSVSGGPTGGSGSSAASYMEIDMPGTGTPQMLTTVAMPLAWDTGKPTSLQLSWYQNCCGSPNVVKWTAGAKCVPMDGSGASDAAKFPTPPTDYNTATSVSSGVANTQIGVGVTLALNTTGCNAGDMMRLFLRRDNTVTSNMGGTARLIGIALDISKKLQ